jgi:adenylate cyclase class 2
MTKLRETEVKIFVGDLDPVRRRLEEAGATLAKPRVFERNIRYDDEARSLSANGQVLRLRQDAAVRLTYKDRASPEAAHYLQIVSRFEAEVTVDDFDVMDTILRRLGYSPCAVYEKYRTTYHLDGAEIVLDEMPYGHFIEVEGHPDAIDRVLDRLELAKAPRLLTSYLVLFDYVKRRLGLPFNDLTFDNFAGLALPPDLFQDVPGL